MLKNQQIMIQARCCQKSAGRPENGGLDGYRQVSGGKGSEKRWLLSKEKAILYPNTVFQINSVNG